MAQRWLKTGLQKSVTGTVGNVWMAATKNHHHHRPSSLLIPPMLKSGYSLSSTTTNPQIGSSVTTSPTSTLNRPTVLAAAPQLRGNMLGLGRSALLVPSPLTTSTITVGKNNFPLPVLHTTTLRAFSIKKKNTNKKTSNIKKKKNKMKEGSSSGNNDQDQAPPSSQLEGWIEFQKSIAVKGFETGQKVDFQRKVTRGGKRFSKRKSKEQVRLEERIKERQRMTDVGGGEFPPLRYNDEETERLLAQAYAAIPERTGKRGTRNLKRQKRRWWLVREIRKKYKKNIMRAHDRRMAERSRRLASVKNVLTVAPDIRTKDKEYQLQVLERWMATTMRGSSTSTTRNNRQQPLLSSGEGSQ
jgi:hypothetical protein